MTTYAYDSSTTTLHATWTCGIGAGARTVARLHARTPERTGMHLAQALTELSDAAWASYTAPALVPLEPAPVLRALRRPNMPDGDLLHVEPDEVLERAHGVGRRLVDLGSAEVQRAVIADVTAEFDAVDRALRGELDGRARQAVALTRLGAPPTQVVAADRLLHDVPLGNEELFADVEPTPACVAALHWAAAAVEVTQRLTGVADVETLLDRARFDPLGPAAVLGMLRAGRAPLAIVQDLVSSAVLAGNGFVLEGERLDLGAHDCPRTTLLDPRRPARHLLGMLTDVVRECFEVYAEHCDPGAVCGEGDWIDMVRHRFDADVRAEAARTADRLLAGGELFDAPPGDV